MGWRTIAALVSVLAACGEGPRAETARGGPGASAEAPAKTPAEVSTPAAAVTKAAPEATKPMDLRSRLGRIFHTLPPPEALESPQPCDPRMVPKGGGPLLVLDGALLEVLGTGLTAADLAGREVGLAAQLDAWRGLSSPVFHRFQRLAADGGKAEQEAALETEIAGLLEGGRLGVMLTEERSVDPGRYRGWLVMYAMGTELPWCWLRIEADGSAVAIQGRVQSLGSAAVAEIVPELKLRWSVDEQAE